LVLAANGKDGLATVALRPSGIFGPGDRFMLPAVAKAIEKGQTKMQIGNNTNLFDWTYVDNVVKAHLLAADKLSLDAKPLTSDDLVVDLPSIDLTIGERRLPTSSAKPTGPSPNPTEADLEADKAFHDPKTAQMRPVLRTKFDSMSTFALNTDYKTTPLTVAGQAFFITNGEPMYMWDFTRALWTGLGDHIEPKKVWVIPRYLATVLGQLSETWSWLSGREANLTTYRVNYLCSIRWYNIEKARRVLGYEPDVSIEEGIRRTVEWYLAEKSQKSG